MASDTDTKKTKSSPPEKGRWFRLAPVRPNLRADMPEFDHLLDLYWGGPERRITGITLRIIGVNAIALLILMLGILYLGQYQNSLINARLQTFEGELDLVTLALSQNAVEDNNDTPRIDFNSAENMVRKLSQTTRQRIRVFDTYGTLLIDSRTMPNLDDRIWIMQDRQRGDLHSIVVLKTMARFILELLPDRRTLPPYPKTTPEQFLTYPDVPEALGGMSSISVWQNDQERIILSAAAPLLVNDQIGGAILLTREATQIEDDIGKVWMDVLKVFLGTLILTTLLSIYLSGVIARPLRKLAKAAEQVRRGQATADDIPDLSHRHDEIGELSIVLRQMTGALWNRMDSIEQFAADVSHELKNPLTSLKSAVETASIVKKAGDRKKLMDIIKHDIERLDRLITDIASASRIDAELSREAFQNINLKDMLGNVVNIYAADPLDRSDNTGHEWNKTIKADKATITTASTSNETITVQGIEGRLAQVFQNLLSNALSFTPDKGIIDVRVIPMKKKVSIVVEDNGPGIPENKLNTIFERFYSERPEHEGYGHHSGLGLSICKQIIDAHGGQVFAENAKDEKGNITGARFTVILKRA